MFLAAFDSRRPLVPRYNARQMRLFTICGLALVGLTTALSAQTLGDLARQERARKSREANIVRRVYVNDDLAIKPAVGDTVPNAAPLDDAKPQPHLSAADTQALKSTIIAQKQKI